MEVIFRQLRRLVQRSPSPPRVIKTSNFPLLDSTIKIEEERMPAYEKGLYYPVRIGEVFKSRYQVISKLGYGANSTHTYAALKVYIYTTRANREAEVLRYLASIKADHLGKSLIRTVEDDFVVDGPKGEHYCLVHQPLLMSLLHLQATFRDNALTEDLLKLALYHIILALDYLHSEAQVIHTDIQAKNLILGTTDKSIFEEWDKSEEQEPSPRKIDGDRIVYQSRTFQKKKGWNAWGVPILCDFGEARIGCPNEGLIQPDLYRAPEVVLGMKWNSKVDIWNVGVMIWDLFEDHHLFDGRDANKQHSDAHLLAEMIALLGSPPLEFLQRSKRSLEYWDEAGNWKGAAEIPENSLEDTEEYLEGGDKELFLQFVRKMLKWDPVERQSAGELLKDEWLNGCT